MAFFNPGCVIKFVLCLANLFFIPISLAMILVGILALNKENVAITQEVINSWHTVSLVILITGVVLAILTVLGFVAPLWESPALLIIYMNMLAMMAIVLAALFAVACFKSNDIFNQARIYFGELTTKFSDKPDAMYVVHQVCKI